MWQIFLNNLLILAFFGKFCPKTSTTLWLENIWQFESEANFLYPWPLCNNLFDWKICNINQIGRPWCQTIGNWGRETRISHSFKHILIKRTKDFLYKSTFDRCNSWQLPCRPNIGSFWRESYVFWSIWKIYGRCEIYCLILH